MDNNNNDVYLECEKNRVFDMLMFVGGFYGAFTYSIRGGVFCNAQTANFVLFAMSLGNMNWKRALYYLIPMSAYLLGSMVSEAIPKPVKRIAHIRWDTMLIAIEMLAVVILGFLPESAPVQITQITVNFITSMQYNTFRQSQGVPMATTFCTNHIRQTGVFMVKAIRSHGERAHVMRFLRHVKMLTMFVLGGVVSTILCRFFLGKALWTLLIPLGILFVDLLKADLTTERDMIDVKPRGH